MEVGVRELKNSLSRYLKRVQMSETVVVTDRGKLIARIIPAGVPPHMVQLLAEGRASWSGQQFEPPRNPIRPRAGRPFSDYIIEDRG